MKRTEWQQETRKMRFEEAYGGWQGRRLTQEEAAEILGVSDRTFRRYETLELPGLGKAPFINIMGIRLTTINQSRRYKVYKRGLAIEKAKL
jgi:hypothetical protein